jgi:hypothetical protein
MSVKSFITLGLEVVGQVQLRGSRRRQRRPLARARLRQLQHQQNRGQTKIGSVLGGRRVGRRGRRRRVEIVKKTFF